MSYFYVNVSLNGSQADSGFTSAVKSNEKIKKYKHILDKTVETLMDKSISSDVYSVHKDTEKDNESQSMINKNPNPHQLFDDTLQLSNLLKYTTN